MNANPTPVPDDNDPPTPPHPMTAEEYEAYLATHQAGREKRAAITKAIDPDTGYVTK